eukprot:gene37660-42653_t
MHTPITPSGDSPELLSAYMEKLLTQQATLIEVAQATQAEHDSHHLSTFDPAFTEYPINSYVLLDPPEGKRPKLQTRKKGTIPGKNFETHISNLHPFNFDATRTDPTKEAMNDNQEYLIGNILGHR